MHKYKIDNYDEFRDKLTPFTKKYSWPMSLFKFYQSHSSDQWRGFNTFLNHTYPYVLKDFGFRKLTEREWTTFLRLRVTDTSDIKELDSDWIFKDSDIYSLSRPIFPWTSLSNDVYLINRLYENTEVDKIKELVGRYEEKFKNRSKKSSDIFRSLHLDTKSIIHTLLDTYETPFHWCKLIYSKPELKAYLPPVLLRLTHIVDSMHFEHVYKHVYSSFKTYIDNPEHTWGKDSKNRLLDTYRQELRSYKSFKRKLDKVSLNETIVMSKYKDFIQQKLGHLNNQFSGAEINDSKLYKSLFRHSFTKSPSLLTKTNCIALAVLYNNNFSIDNKIDDVLNILSVKEDSYRPSVAQRILLNSMRHKLDVFKDPARFKELYLKFSRPEIARATRTSFNQIFNSLTPETKDELFKDILSQKILNKETANRLPYSCGLQLYIPVLNKISLTTRMEVLDILINKLDNSFYGPAHGLFIDLFDSNEVKFKTDIDDPDEEYHSINQYNRLVHYLPEKETLIRELESLGLGLEDTIRHILMENMHVEYESLPNDLFL